MQISGPGPSRLSAALENGSPRASPLPPLRTRSIDDHDHDSDFDDSIADPGDDVLTADPLHRDASPTRKSYVGLGFPLPAFITSRLVAPENRTTNPGNLRRRHTPTTPTHPAEDRFELPFDDLDSVTETPRQEYDPKDPTITVDWYTEGPGRRVGYDDLTAIDWIFEYAKERQRLRVLLSSTAGAAGHFRRFLDASEIWWLLILTGIGTGILAASIDVVSDWLGDIKEGVCTTGPGGGRFYLNKTFCCWGLDGMYLKTTFIG